MQKIEGQKCEITSCNWKTCATNKFPICQSCNHSLALWKILDAFFFLFHCCMIRATRKQHTIQMTFNASKEPSNLFLFNMYNIQIECHFFQFPEFYKFSHDIRYRKIDDYECDLMSFNSMNPIRFSMISLLINAELIRWWFCWHINHG